VVVVVEIIDIEDIKGLWKHSSLFLEGPKKTGPFGPFFTNLLEKYNLNCYNLKYIKGEKWWKK